MKPSLSAIVPTISCVAMGLFLTGCTHTESVSKNTEDPVWPSEVPQGKIDFKKHIRPILTINCLECHNSKNAAQNGNLNLETKALAMTTGTQPPVLVPGKPDESLMIQVLTFDLLHQKNMPPSPDKIWGVRMEILRKWIEQGADWPEDVRLVHPEDVKEWW